MNELFVKASRLALRFKSNVGSITTEDLWNLSLTQLDTIAKSLNKEIKLAEEESFIKTKTKTDDVLETAFEVVKYIITVKLAEAEAKKLAAARKEQKAILMEAYVRAEGKELEGKSKEEIKAMIEALQ